LAFLWSQKYRMEGVDQRSTVILQVIWTSLAAGIRTTERKPGCNLEDKERDERLSSSESRQKWLDSGWILREEPRGFPKELAALCELRRGVVISTCFCLQHLKNAIAVNWKKENLVKKTEEVWSGK
jgi:hypothetical protein